MADYLLLSQQNRHLHSQLTLVEVHASVGVRVSQAIHVADYLPLSQQNRHPHSQLTLVEVHVSVDVRVRQEIFVAEDATKHSPSIRQDSWLADSLPIHWLIDHIQPETACI